MRSAYLKDVVRSVKGSLGRFLAILGIAALGCGFFAGLQMSGPDMRAAADSFYDGCSLYDIRLVSTLGFSSDDVDRIEKVQGVGAAMPSMTCDVIARLDRQRMAVRISSLDIEAAKNSEQLSGYAVASDDAGYLNRLMLREGRWPETAGECVITADKDYPVGFGLGDTVQVLYGTQDLDELLSRRTFTVVGRVSSPCYPYTGSFGSTTLGSGMIDQYLYVTPDSFTEDLPFTEVFVTVPEALEFTSGSAPYEEAVDEVRERFEALAMELGSARLEDVRADAQKKLDEKRADYLEERADAERKLDDAASELRDAARRLEDGESELESGQREYDQGVAEFAQSKKDAEQQLADAQTLIDDGWAELASSEAILAEGERAFSDGERELEEGKAALDAGEKELADNTRKLEEAQKAYEQGLAEIEEGERALNMTQADIDQARAELEAGRALWDAKRAQLVLASDDLSACSTALAAARELSSLDIVPELGQLDSLTEQLDQGVAATHELASLELDGFDTAALALQLRGLLEQAKSNAAAIVMDGSVDPTDIIEQIHHIAPDGTDGMIALAGGAQGQIEGAISQGDAQMDDASQALDQAQQARDELDQGRAALEAAKKELDAGRAGLEKGRAELEKNRAKYDAGRAELESKRKELADGRSELEQARDKLLSSERDLATGRAEADAKIRDGEEQLSDALAELQSGREELDEGRASYLDGLGTYLSSRREADEQFADAEAQLADAQREIDELEPPDIYALDRTKNEGVVTYNDDTLRMDSIANVFPVIFFLVAALVSLTTMTRMVDDDRVLIGTYKALGYSKAKIAAKYLAYAGVASALGATLGILLLSQVLPYIVISSYGIIYAVPIHPFPMPVIAPIALLSGGLGVGVTLVATYAAVIASLRETPAMLMLPRAPKAGKRILLERITPIWSRLSFSWKVTCRNIFRYKRRLAMTIIGISGCTALLLTGFGLHDAIWDIIDNQYGPIVHYDTTVALDDEAIGLDADRVEKMLDEHDDVSDIVRVQRENLQAGAVGYDGQLMRVQVIIPRTTEELQQAMTLRSRRGHEPIRFDDDAVVITEKISMKLGIGAGDKVLLYDQNVVGDAVGQGHELTVTGVAENYVGNSVYVGKRAWKAIDETPPVYQTIFANVSDGPSVREALSNELADVKNVSTVLYSDETIALYRSMLQVVDLIVVVLIVSAAALAFIVLFNLTNINVSERVREIASLKVLGFTKGEVYAYIFREIALLSVAGDLVGMLFGTWLAHFVVITAEVDYVMFGRTIHVPSYLYSFMLTLLFTALVIFCMRKKLDRVDMVESLKSVD